MKAWYASGSESAKRVVKHITELCPMKDPESVKKLKATLKRIGHKPPIQGGNGHPTPEPQRLLAELLGLESYLEYGVLTKSRRGSGIPYLYKIDIADPAKKIAIEVDGMSHNNAIARDRDARKDKFLLSIGWTVLRFSNKEILTWINSGMPKDAYISTTLESANIRPTR
jgi:very-short-patch-repair endonuclease